MLDYLPLKSFKAIYVVDLCSSLCEQVAHTTEKSCTRRKRPLHCNQISNWHMMYESLVALSVSA